MKHVILAALLATSIGAYGVESETVKGAQKDYQSFKTDMNERLKDLDQQLTDLRAKAEKTGTETQKKAIHDLEVTKAQLQTQLDDQVAQAQKTSTQSWKDFKEGFAKSVDRLNTKIQKALN